ncbi:MAG TPA: hypothetical protein ENN80_14325, partial [Candidatus Hydrogenedentes bacterium]|nr:hypothetical protein [Candidatus Hydrogenedentota bacterium]
MGIKATMTACSVIAMALVIPMTAHAANPVDVDFDQMLRTVDELGPLLSEEAGVPVILPTFSGADNDGNGMDEDDNLAMLKAILMRGRSGYTGVNQLDGAMCELIKDDFQYNRQAFYDDFQIQGSGLLWTLFKDYIKDMLGGSYSPFPLLEEEVGPAMCDAIKDLFAGYATIGDPSTFTFLNNFITEMINTLIPIFAGDLGIPTELIGVLADWIDINPAAYRSWGTNNGQRNRTELSPSGNVDYNVDGGATTNLQEYNAAGRNRETFLTNCHITPPLNITVHPSPANVEVYIGDYHPISVTTTGGQGATRVFKWGYLDDLDEGIDPTIVYTGPATSAWSDTYVVGPFSPALEHRYVAQISDAIWTVTSSGSTLESLGAKPLLGTGPTGSVLMGDYVNITWQNNAGGAFVRLALHRYEGTFIGWINRKTTNDGVYLWRVPADLAPGPGYQIRIQSFNDPAVRDFGPLFTVVAPDIVLGSPNGGERWVPGDTHNILWNAPAAGAYVRLALHVNGSFYDWINRKTENDGSYAW